MKLSKISIPLEVISGGANLILLDVAPYNAYVDGKKTDTIVGYRYTVVEDKTFEKLIIKIPSSEPAFTQEQIASSKERIKVSFDGAVAKPYRTMSGDYDLSISATAIRTVK